MRRRRGGWVAVACSEGVSVAVMLMGRYRGCGAGLAGVVVVVRGVCGPELRVLALLLRRRGRCWQLCRLAHGVLVAPRSIGGAGCAAPCAERGALRGCIAVLMSGRGALICGAERSGARRAPGSWRCEAEEAAARRCEFRDGLGAKAERGWLAGRGAQSGAAERSGA